jgi:Arc/MetJ-type ribon-helix-helix transcriptional regulator
VLHLHMANLTARIEPELTEFIAQYQVKHQLENRSEVIRLALRALQQIERRQELRQGYLQMAQETHSDEWLDSDLTQTLEPQ